MDLFLPSFYSFIAILAFSVIFNIKGKNTWIAAIGGGLSWFFYIFSLKYIISQPLAFFYASVAVAIYSEIMARVRKCPVTIFIICGILPLVPGGGMYYTMLASVQGNVTKSLNTGLSTLTIAGAIAVGVILVSSLTRLITFYHKKNNCAKV
jgi:uncharacterized membrane protein YjjB (DUF3815 family)